MDVGCEMLNTEQQQSSTTQCHMAQQRSESSPPPSKKRTVQKSMVDWWNAESDKMLSMAMWLVYEKDRTNRSRVVSLKCSVCARFHRNWSVCATTIQCLWRGPTISVLQASKTTQAARCMLGQCNSIKSR